MAPLLGGRSAWRKQRFRSLCSLGIASSSPATAHQRPVNASAGALEVRVCGFGSSRHRILADATTTTTDPGSSGDSVQTQLLVGCRGQGVAVLLELILIRLLSGSFSFLWLLPALMEREQGRFHIREVIPEGLGGFLCALE